MIKDMTCGSHLNKRPIHHIAIYVLCLLAYFLSAPAFAQDLPDTPQNTKTGLEDVPDEYIDEALAFYDYCAGKAKMREYYDCQCLSGKYLDTRIKMGPKSNRSTIMLSIEKSCQDATEAAGTQFTRCMTNRAIMPKNVPAKEFCECYANTYSTLYETLEAKPSSKTFVTLQSQAITRCRNPEMAKRLYPNQPQ